MKKQLTILVACICLSITAFSQTKFGAGATYVNDFGVQARASLDVGETMGLIPSFSYYFAGSGLSVISADANLTFNVTELSDGVALYALAGIDWTNVSFSGISDSEFGINAGAGADVSTNIYVEAFYRRFLCSGCGGEIGFNAGYYF